jgi:predicted secreted hydrolase
VSVPEEGLQLEIGPGVADQELRVGTRYWKGAAEVVASTGGRGLRGRGYVELVGYGE